jgi:hypothetical protein
VFEESTARFASMISWGDTEDTIFMTLAERYAAALRTRGHFAAICHHIGGHIQPGAMVAVALDFLLAHPYGTIDSPFAAGFPESYPEYCSP